MPGAEVYDALEAFSIPSNDGELSSGSSAATLLALLTGTESQRQHLPDAPHQPRAVHKRWKFVFEQIEAGFGLSVPAGTRENIFCGDTSACERLLDEVVVQAKAAKTFSMALEDHQRQKESQRVEELKALQQQQGVTPTKPAMVAPMTLGGTPTNNNIGGPLPLTAGSPMSPPHHLPSMDATTPNSNMPLQQSPFISPIPHVVPASSSSASPAPLYSPQPYAGTTVGDLEHHIGPLKPLKLVSSVSVGTDPNPDDRTGIELLTSAALKRQKQLARQKKPRGRFGVISPQKDSSREHPSEKLTAGAMVARRTERDSQRQQKTLEKKRKAQEDRVKQAEQAMVKEEEERAFRARMYEKALARGAASKAKLQEQREEERRKKELQEQHEATEDRKKRHAVATSYPTNSKAKSAALASLDPKLRRDILVAEGTITDLDTVLAEEEAANDSVRLSPLQRNAEGTSNRKPMTLGMPPPSSVAKSPMPKPSPAKRSKSSSQKQQEADEERRRRARSLLDAFKPKTPPPTGVAMLSKISTPSNVSSMPPSQGVSSLGDDGGSEFDPQSPSHRNNARQHGSKRKSASPSHKASDENAHEEELSSFHDSFDDLDEHIQERSVVHRHQHSFTSEAAASSIMDDFRHGAGTQSSTTFAIVETHEIGVGASPTPVERADVSVGMRPIPTIREIVTTVQTFIRSWQTMQHNVFHRKRDPAATYFQLLYRFVVHRRRTKGLPPAYEEFPSKPLTSCPRCLPILKALERYVVVHHAVSGKQLEGYRQWCCGPPSEDDNATNDQHTPRCTNNCRGLINSIVARTQDGNIYRDDHGSLRLLAKIQGALRWQLSMNELDRKIHLSHIAYAHKFERTPREMEILNTVQMLFLFNKWKRLFRTPRENIGVGQCQRCGPIVEAFTERSKTCGVNAFDRSKYLDLMCDDCAEVIESTISNINVMRCVGLLSTVVKALSLLKRKMRWAREKRAAESGVALLAKRKSRFHPTCCNRCGPIIDALGERLLVDRNEELIGPYGLLMCGTCRKNWAVDACQHVNVFVATKALMAVVRAKIALIRWSGRTPALDCIAAYPQNPRDAPILDELEKRLFVNADLDPQIVERYKKLLSPQAAAAVHYRCTSARTRIQWTILIQLMHRFRMHMRGVHERRRKARVLLEADCRRCDPIKQALNERIRANPHIEPKKLKRYTAIMCKNCTPQAEDGISHFVAQRFTVRFFERVYFFIRMRRLIPKRRKPAATRGECPRCGPILEVYKKALQKCAHDERVREDLGEKYVPIVCDRCRFQVMSLARYGVVEQTNKTTSSPAVQQDQVDIVPGSATVVPKRIRGIHPMIDLHEVHNGKAQEIQRHLRWLQSLKRVATLCLLVEAQVFPDKTLNTVKMFQCRYSFLQTMKKKGGVMLGDEYAWGCERCSPIVSSMMDRVNVNPNCSVQLYDKYLNLMCKPTCVNRALEELDILSSHPKASRNNNGSWGTWDPTSGTANNSNTGGGFDIVVEDSSTQPQSAQPVLGESADAGNVQPSSIKEPQDDNAATPANENLEIAGALASPTTGASSGKRKLRRVLGMS